MFILFYNYKYQSKDLKRNNICYPQSLYKTWSLGVIDILKYI